LIQIDSPYQKKIVLYRTISYEKVFTKTAKAKFSIMERIKQIVEKKLRSKNSRSKSQLKIARFKLR